MNRKNTFHIDRHGNTVDRYGRVFEMDSREFKKRRKRKEAYPAPNSMKCK
jgi:hypothetical protein